MHLAFEVKSMSDFKEHIKSIGVTLATDLQKVHPVQYLPLWMHLTDKR